MNYIETCTKMHFFLWRSSNYRPLKSVLHVRPGWIIYQNMRETWEKKVMKFEREIPIGLDVDARRKKPQGGGLNQPPPPNGIRVKSKFYLNTYNVLHWGFRLYCYATMSHHKIFIHCAYFLSMLYRCLTSSRRGLRSSTPSWRPT